MWLGMSVGVAVAVTTIAVRASAGPKTFRIERAATIAAPPEKVFRWIEDFHAWPKWSPWAKLDPNMVMQFEGPEKGVGASYAWTGNKRVGHGKMTIREVAPNRLLRFDLHFIKPFAAENLGEFHLEPTAGGTRITWAMSGTNKFFNKVFALFVDVDKMVGKDFEAGLAAIKQLSEQGPAALSSPATDTPSA